MGNPAAIVESADNAFVSNRAPVENSAPVSVQAQIEQLPGLIADPPATVPDSSQAAGAPIIQVGDDRFCLPAPALAVQRISDLWKPGAQFVVITTQHYGTPLLCPEGDTEKGLINLAPSGESAQELVPLYWQNCKEAEIHRERADKSSTFRRKRAGISPVVLAKLQGGRNPSARSHRECRIGCRPPVLWSWVRFAGYDRGRGRRG